MDIDTNVKPIQQPVRRVAIVLKTKLTEELDRLERWNVIHKIDKLTDWVSSIGIVQKPNGKLRICLDPKLLNQDLKWSHYRIPTLEEV